MESSKEEPVLTLKERYASKVDKNGYLYVADFATQELRKQSKNISAFLDGDEGTSPEYNLGSGLRYQGESGNYTDMKIHIDDLAEFLRRVKEHYGDPE
ncbi:MAG: hypothetical protein KBC35_03825 [Candidatus Pacebacteria bacterium]|nr:hypothetical protein [Candidatus Paceibacterota bacterium]